MHAVVSSIDLSCRNKNFFTGSCFFPKIWFWIELFLAQQIERKLVLLLGSLVLRVRQQWSSTNKRTRRSHRHLRDRVNYQCTSGCFRHKEKIIKIIILFKLCRLNICRPLFGGNIYVDLLCLTQREYSFSVRQEVFCYHTLLDRWYQASQQGWYQADFRQHLIELLLWSNPQGAEDFQLNLEEY